MQTHPLPLSRLAATEYFSLGHPEYTTATEFGDFVHHPEYPDRYDANKILGFRCDPSYVDGALAKVTERFRDAGLPFINLCGHCNETYHALLGALQPGDRFHTDWMLVRCRAPDLESNPDVTIEVVQPGSRREDELCATAPSLSRHAYYRSCDPHVGGRLVFAHLDGEVAGTAGWIVHDSVARFKHVHTVERFRRRGVASTMLRFVQTQPQVLEQDGLVIFCDTESTIRLYERLGFVRHGYIWALFRTL